METVAAAASVAAYHVAETDLERLVTMSRSSSDSCWRTLSPHRSRWSSGTGEAVVAVAGVAVAAADAAGATVRDGVRGCAGDGAVFAFGAWFAGADGGIVTSFDDWRWCPLRSPGWRLECRHSGRAVGSVDLKSK